MAYNGDNGINSANATGAFRRVVYMDVARNVAIVGIKKRKISFVDMAKNMRSGSAIAARQWRM